MAHIKDGSLFVTKSVKIPVGKIYRISPDLNHGVVKVISDRGVTFVTDSFDELKTMLPDLCVDDR